MVGQVGLGVEAVRAHAHAHALTKAALPVLALVCRLSGGCPVQQLQQAVHATAPHPHPPFAVCTSSLQTAAGRRSGRSSLRRCTQSASWRPSRPQSPTPVGLSGQTMAAQGLYTRLEGELFEALCCSQPAGKSAARQPCPAVVW